jgi:hypothetical protein
MSARDLLCEGEAYAAAGWLGCVERHEQVLAVGDAKAGVFNENFENRLRDVLSDPHRIRTVGH